MKFVKSSYVVFVILTVSLISFFGVLTYVNDVVVYNLKNNVKPDNIDIYSNTKFILYWLPMWQDITFSFNSTGYGPFKNCKFRNCFATHDKGMVPIDKFSAVIFHAAQYESGYGQPIIRTANQRYIFGNMESPVTCHPESWVFYRSFYNWTMTYRIDSDIPMRYGYIIKNTANYTIPNTEFVKNKTGLVAWIVSHCDTKNRRKKVYNELRKFLNIDVYGMCGNSLCPGEIVYNKKSPESCYDFVEQKYKFYLSFENSHCKDYVTEKLYLALKRNIVPIAYGFADYEYLAPPNSVIVVDKFQTLKDLANYILYLDKNPQAYLKYFEWKKYYYIDNNPLRTACTLCRMLNDPLEPGKTYLDLYTWWLGKNGSYCKDMSQ